MLHARAHVRKGTCACMCACGAVHRVHAHFARCLQHGASAEERGDAGVGEEADALREVEREEARAARGSDALQPLVRHLAPLEHQLGQPEERELLLLESAGGDGVAEDALARARRQVVERAWQPQQLRGDRLAAQLGQRRHAVDASLLVEHCANASAS